MSCSNKEKPAILMAGGRMTDASAAARTLSKVFANGDKPDVAYIGAANGDKTLFFTFAKSLLLRAGAGRIELVRLTRRAQDAEAIRDALCRAQVIFLSGGEVEDGMDWIVRHDLVDLLRELYCEGRQFIGVSAGAIMLGSQWVRWDDPKDDATARLFGCLGIVPAVFDTHAEDEDWIELKTALRLSGEGAWGYGLKSGNTVSADSSAAIRNLAGAYLIYTYKEGRFQIEEVGG